MEVFWASLSVTLAQIPGLILRYIPFSRLVSKKQKNNLLLGYAVFYILQNLLLFIAVSKTNAAINPLLYKIVVTVGSSAYFFVNCIVIRKMFFQHVFVYGMQASYCLVLHSFVAIILGLYGKSIVIYKQLMIQSSTFLLLFILAALPLWKLIKSSFILNISSDHNYYWNIIWMISVLLCISDIIITMDGNWISTWRQLVTRILTGIIIFVLWNCVNLNFKEIQEKLKLSETNKLLHIQMEAISHQAKTISENDEKIRILRHDMRHNVQILSSLIASG